MDKQRRLFLKGLAGVGLGLLSWPLIKPLLYKPSTKLVMHGTSPMSAHRVLQQDFPQATNLFKKEVVIVGSGIAGLTCARHLYQNGIRDFSILELESMIGGNASWGENSASNYPWAAHYLPIPSVESEFLFEFLKESGVITGFNAQGEPYYNEQYLCHDLKERLYLNGSWHEGIVPNNGIPDKDKHEIMRFFSLMETYKAAQGNDGRFAFTIPIDLSSQDQNFRELDLITMAVFLQKNQFHSPYLLWYVNYCCRDDYGAGIDKISAWAGIHYFASRRTRAANCEQDAILTWPNGNGFLTQQLAKNFLHTITTQAQVYDITPNDQQYNVSYFDLKSHQSNTITAKAVILAIPRFIAHKICHNNFTDCFDGVSQFEYSPWMVANIHLRALGKTQGAPLAWDNVSYYSPSVGYIDSQHQSLKSQFSSSVITYYLPLDHLSPQMARNEALQRQSEFWEKMIIQDLQTIHQDITSQLIQIDARVLGHAMIRPAPNLIWGKVRRALKRAQGGLFFAHSDMSGISIFEEAYWQGLTTAQHVLEYLVDAPHPLFHRNK